MTYDADWISKKVDELLEQAAYTAGKVYGVNLSKAACRRVRKSILHVFKEEVVHEALGRPVKRRKI